MNIFFGSDIVLKSSTYNNPFNLLTKVLQCEYYLDHHYTDEETEA